MEGLLGFTNRNRFDHGSHIELLASFDCALGGRRKEVELLRQKQLGRTISLSQSSGLPHGARACITRPEGSLSLLRGMKQRASLSLKATSFAALVSLLIAVESTQVSKHYLRMCT